MPTLKEPPQNSEAMAGMHCEAPSPREVNGTRGAKAGMALGLPRPAFEWGSGMWEVEVVSGKWKVVNRKWDVGSGKWEAGSGKRELGSGKWGV